MDHRSLNIERLVTQASSIAVLGLIGPSDPERCQRFFTEYYLQIYARGMISDLEGPETVILGVA